MINIKKIGQNKMEKDQELQKPLLLKLESKGSLSFQKELEYISKSKEEEVEQKETELNEFFTEEYNEKNRSLSSHSEPETFSYENTISQPQKQFLFNRLQVLQNFKFRQFEKPKNIIVETNLTLILLREMKQDPKLILAMMVSNIMDIIIRINCFVLLFIIILNDVEAMRIIAGLLLISPRLIQFLSTLKLLIINLHKKQNESLLQISILLRQNFKAIEWDNLSKEEWYSWKQRDIFINSSKLQILLFLFFPTELSILQFRNFNGKLTYLVQNFILKTIEIIIFSPWVLLVLYADHFLIDESVLNTRYRSLSIFLLYVDIGKYILISVFYLTKRNYQLNRFQIRN